MTAPLRNGSSPLPVSVVISVYNRAELLDRALRSIEAQQRRPDEVIVVDDASTDGSHLVAEARGARVIRLAENRGTSAAKQAGLEAAEHEWVALLDSDDEWLPDHLATLWELREGNVLVATSVIECGEDGGERSFHGALSDRPARLTSPAAVLYPENPIPDSAVMLRRDEALAAGGFREVRCEDLDVWCRLLSRGPGTVTPEVGALFYRHPGQISADWEAIHASHLEIAASYAGAEWWSPGIVERRRGVTSWDRYRARRREGERGGLAALLRHLAGRPQRMLGVLGVVRHRLAMRRRASRLALGGGPSVAVLPGADGDAVRPEDRYETDLTRTGTLPALLRLLRRPSSRAVVSSRAQAALVRLAGVEPVRARGASRG